MPNCRNCGARLTKFDNDICPVCGTKDPLKGVSSETIEITSQIDINDFKEGQKVVCRKQKVFLLFALLGLFGAGYFYLKQKKLAILWLVTNLLLLAAVFMLLFFAAHLHIALAVIIPILTVYIINIVVGAVYYFVPNLKDGEGEFIV